MDTNNEWEIEVLMERYAYLKITPAQAQKIYLLEKDKDYFTWDFVFSTWEEYDFELASFSEILTEGQFSVYKKERDKNLIEVEKGIAEQDKNILNDIAYEKESLEYLENIFVPDFYKNQHIPHLHLHYERSKVRLLKEEYQKFLLDTRKKIFVEHFRFSRRLEPNKLTLSLLRHRRNYIWPNYSYFKSEMDAPTKAVADYLAQKLHFFDEIKELHDKKAAESKEFHDRLFKKYQKDTSGWHVTIETPSQKEQEENDLMTLLLLSEDKYGLI